MPTQQDKLWQFSLASWQTQNTRECALALQDQFSLEPNILLLALYLEQEQTYLDTAQFDSLLQGTESWRQRILTPYRQLRRQSKGRLSAEQYARMLKLELKIEQSFQKKLLQALTQIEPQHSGDNLTAYLEASHLSLSQLPESIRQKLVFLFHT